MPNLTSNVPTKLKMYRPGGDSNMGLPDAIRARYWLALTFLKKKKKNQISTKGRKIAFNLLGHGKNQSATCIFVLIIECLLQHF